MNAHQPENHAVSTNIISCQHTIPCGTWWASGIHLYGLFLPENKNTAPLTRKKSLLVQTMSKLFFSQQSTRDSASTRIVRDTANEKRSTSASHLWSGTRHIEGWQLIHISLPISNAQQHAQLPRISLHELSPLFAQMQSYACSHRDSAGRSVGYLIFHIEEIGYAGENQKKHRRGRKDQPLSDPRVDLRAIFDAFDRLRPGEPRGYFRHYDAIKKRRGYLIVGRNATLLADLSDERLTSLLPLLQGSALAIEGGFTAEGLSTALTRVAQWDANQDIRESIDEIAEVKKSSDVSTRGQVWLSYALALIGIALSLISFVAHPAYLAPGLVLLALSGIAHARFAQKGTSNWHLTGTVVFWLGIIVTMAGFLLGIQQKFPSKLPWW
jgi:hypothetical protein